MSLFQVVVSCLRVDDMAAAESNVGAPEVKPDWLLPTDREAIYLDGVEDGAEAADHSGLRGRQMPNTFAQMAVAELD